jgi:glutamyl-tRNA reductase
MTTTSSGNTDVRPAVTVIGLGEMGTALAGVFLEGGHPTTVWNRTPEKADALVAKGARWAVTVRDAVAASPLVVVSVISGGGHPPARCRSYSLMVTVRCTRLALLVSH